MDFNCSFKIPQITECKHTSFRIIYWLPPGNEPFMILTALFCGRKTPFIIDLYVSPDFHGGVWKSGVGGGAWHIARHMQQVLFEHAPLFQTRLQGILISLYNLQVASSNVYFPTLFLFHHRLSRRAPGY